MMDKFSSHRLRSKHSFWDGKRKGFFIATSMSFILLQVLFLGNFSYLFGSLFRNSQRTHNMNILMVNYDDGAISQAALGAYQTLKADSFPTFDVQSSIRYPDSESIRHAVCKGHYWAAVYTHKQASDRLSNAILENTAASNYNSSDTITYVYNGARYPTVQSGYIISNLETFISVISVAYHDANSSWVARNMNNTSPASLMAFSNPIMATSYDLMPTEQGARPLLNTVVMVLTIIQQFFFLMALNGISSAFSFTSHLPIRTNGLIRLSFSFTYTFVAAICTTGFIWAYREDWGVDGKQYILTALTFWLYMHVNFLVLDTATGFIPMSFLPFFVLTWAILNVTSTIFPFELNPGFYRWAYALPAHEAFQMLVQIWSNGCSNQLSHALPILFAWEVVGGFAGMVANRNRCIAATPKMNDQGDDATSMTTLNPGQDQPRRPSQQNTEPEPGSRGSNGPSYPQPFIDRLSRTGTV